MRRRKQGVLRQAGCDTNLEQRCAGDKCDEEGLDGDDDDVRDVPRAEKGGGAQPHRLHALAHLLLLLKHDFAQQARSGVQEAEGEHEGEQLQPNKS